MTRKKKTAVGLGVIGAIATWLHLRPRRSHKPSARSPFHLPWRSHRSVVREVLGDMNDGNTMVLAAGIAYFAALAFFPSFALALAVASIMITPEQVAAVVRDINVYLPPDLAGVVTTQLEAQAGKFGGNLVIAVIAVVISLIGASAATENTLRSLNVAYRVRETRNLVKLRALSVLVLLLALLFAVVVAALLIVDDYMVGWGVPATLVDVISVLRWPLLLVLVSWACAALYRYGPNRPRAKWRWVSWGATIATALWLVTTAILFAITRYTATFQASYTLFAGIILLLVWFNFSALALLIGAHVNARLESKTRLPTTK